MSELIISCRHMWTLAGADPIGLEGRERSSPRKLSGGQQRRAGIALSLAVDRLA